MGRMRSQALRATASSTLHRMAKKTSELTSQVEPKSRAKVTRLRVSSSMKAAPRKNIWGWKPRQAPRPASPETRPRAHRATIPSPAR